VNFFLLTKLAQKAVVLNLIFLAIMSLFRFTLFTFFAPSNVSFFSSDVYNAFFLGLRLDLSVLAYVNLVLFLLLLITSALKVSLKSVITFVRLYYTVMFLLISAILSMDIGFYSFFSSHITILFFGIFDDDTLALWHSLEQNYPTTLIFITSFFYALFLYFLVARIIALTEKNSEQNSKMKMLSFTLITLTLLFLMARGSIGMYPLSKIIPNVSNNAFVNDLALNGVFALEKAYKYYKQNRDNHYDIIKQMGYSKKNIQAAYKDYLQLKFNKNNITLDDANLTHNLQQRTPYNAILEKHKPNVVLIMGESFGAPILKYQSPEFDIMRSLKHHFDANPVFSNFISASNGTIVSMEPLLLNITARPNATTFGQSDFMNTSFLQAAAKVYQKAGYETTLIYGGDLGWRNVGKFFPLQGFDHLVGKHKIIETLHIDPVKDTHDWGVYDEFSLTYLFNQLKNAKKPQFIFILTTNNHPPFILHQGYKSKTLHINATLDKVLKGERSLIMKRLYDYQYALDSVGHFMDKITQDPLLSKNTLVALTADNDTLEGIMNFKNPIAEAKKIPFFLHIPKYIHHKQIDTSIAGSHKDIFPTLYNLTLSNVSYIAMGTNLLDANVTHCGFNDAGNIVTNDGAFKFGNPQNQEQQKCQKFYKATLATQEHLLQSQLTKGTMHEK